MSLYGSSVEYGLHCLLHLAEPSADGPFSSRDLAEFQGVSPSYVAKLFTQLEKAGIVESAEGVGGGFRLARPAASVTVLDVVRALEGEKPLFRCREVRRNCVLYSDDPPDWATRGVCSIHALMIEAEKQMLAVLGDRTLADLAGDVGGKIPKSFGERKSDWFDGRRQVRRGVGGRTGSGKAEGTQR
ncbi:MAG: Rrf2 family transcriptional regulator [Rhodospirillaceae bacterium]